MTVEGGEILLQNPVWFRNYSSFSFQIYFSGYQNCSIFFSLSLKFLLQHFFSLSNCNKYSKYLHFNSCSDVLSSKETTSIPCLLSRSHFSLSALFCHVFKSIWRTCKSELKLIKANIAAVKHLKREKNVSWKFTVQGNSVFLKFENRKNAGDFEMLWFIAGFRDGDSWHYTHSRACWLQ